MIPPDIRPVERQVSRDIVVLDQATGVSSAKTGDFKQGIDGQRMAFSKWEQANASGGFTIGGTWGGSFGSAWLPGARLAREGAQAAHVAGELLTSNTTIATLVEVLKTNALGTGLTLSSKPDHVVLKITEDEARRFADEIEHRWNAWANDAREVDSAGRHNLHDIAGAAFDSYLLNGEVVVVLDWLDCDATTKTKVTLLDPRQLDRTRNSEGSTNGVQFNSQGRVVGYWLRTFTPGSVFETAQSKLVPIATPWNRKKVLHVYDLNLPGQTRGISPLAAALSPAIEQAALQEYTLAGAMNHAAFSISIESDLPSNIALAGLSTQDYGDRVPFPVEQWMDTKGIFYDRVKINTKPGSINHLPQGDKLKFNRSESPNSTYEPFDKSLKRTAARAAGALVEDLTGDFKDTSFSASRMATEQPHRVTLRRRAMILERLYREIFTCWLEEMIETSVIAKPSGAPEFWQARAAYARSKWRGPGRVQPDIKKAAEAAILRINSGLSTIEAELAEEGLDFEEVLRQRAHEKRRMEEMGLLGFVALPGLVTTQNKITTDETEAEREGKSE